MDNVASLSPYLLRAFYEWSVDNELTPQISVVVNDDPDLQVPAEFVEDGMIVLNVGPLATGSMNLGNDYVTFDARFNGEVKHIRVPVGNINAIFVRENGFGIPFEVKVQPVKSRRNAPKRGFTKVDVD